MRVCFIIAWLWNSPYTFEKQIEPAFAHNPTVHKHPDGTYVIYHIGNGVPSSHGKPINNCINGTTPPSATVRTGASQSSAGAVAANVPGDSDGGGTSIGQDADTVLGPSPPEIGSIVAPTMLISRSPTGPWSRAPTTRAPPRTGEGGRESPGASSCNNPAAYFFPNGTVVLICKVMSAPSNGIRQMQVSTAPSWRGPCTTVTRSTAAACNCSPSLESSDGGVRTLALLCYAFLPPPLRCILMERATMLQARTLSGVRQRCSAKMHSSGGRTKMATFTWYALCLCVCAFRMAVPCSPLALPLLLCSSCSRAVSLLSAATLLPCPFYSRKLQQIEKPNQVQTKAAPPPRTRW